MFSLSKILLQVLKFLQSFLAEKLPVATITNKLDISQQSIEKNYENLDVHKTNSSDEIPAIVYKGCSRAVCKSLKTMWCFKETEKTR